MPIPKLSPYTRFCVKHLRHPSGPLAGEPFRPLPWQAEIADALLHTFQSDGSPQYRNAYIACARGSGKTTWMASILLYLLIADKSQTNPKLVSASTSAEHASHVFLAAKEFIWSSPTLSTLKTLHPLQYEIKYKRSGSLRAVSSQSRKGLGITPTAILFDESAFLTDHEHYSSLLSSAAKRRDSRLIHISTAADLPESSLGRELWDRYLAVDKGEIDDPHTLTRFFLPSKENPSLDDEQAWHEANPSLGHTVDLATMRLKASQAKLSPLEERTFRIYHLNQWQSSLAAYIDPSEWTECAKPLADWPDEVYTWPCYMGLDLSKTTDLTSLALVFASHDTAEPLYILPRSYVPAARVDTIERQRRIPLSQWIARGELVPLPGNVIDQEAVTDDITQLAQQYDVQDIGYDPFLAAMLASTLANRGLLVTKVRQGGLTLGEPIRTLRDLVLAKKIGHPANGPLNHAIETASVYEGRGGLVSLRKAPGASATIDPLSAAVTALERVLYARQGFLLDSAPQEIITDADSVFKLY